MTKARHQGGPTATPTSPDRMVAEPANTRSYRTRRWARLALDELLDVEHQPAPDPLCDGRHHPGQRCDWWATCTGMSLSYPERESRGRAMAGAWSP